jgi:hypothetical protein
MSMDCPNCLTPWKCNGPHLEKIDNNHYSSSDGYYIRENNIWKFLPADRLFSSDELLNILTFLKEINEHEQFKKSR